MVNHHISHHLGYIVFFQLPSENPKNSCLNYGCQKPTFDHVQMIISKLPISLMGFLSRHENLKTQRFCPKVSQVYTPPQVAIYFRPLIGAPCHSIYNARQPGPILGHVLYLPTSSNLSSKKFPGHGQGGGVTRTFSGG